MRSQPIPEGSTAPTDDEFCDRMLGMRPCYVRGLGYRIIAPSSRSSRAEIHSTCQARLMEVQRQTVENRQQIEQRAQEMTACIDQYQQFQINMMERMAQMEQMSQPSLSSIVDLSSVEHSPSPPCSPRIDM